MSFSDLKARVPLVLASALRSDNLIQHWPLLRLSLMAACGLVILWYLASLAWLLMPTPAPASLTLAPGALSYDDRPIRTAPVDINEIRSWDLFGEVPLKTKAESAASEAPDEIALTPLTTILVGLLYSSNMAVARAILRHKNDEERYKVGDDLPEGDAVIESIEKDHVTVRRGEELLTLRLFEKRADNSAKLGKARRTIDNSDNKRLNQLTSRYREQILKDTTQLTQYLRFAPVRRNGNLIGYRIRARRDIGNFRKLGFKNNDVVTGMNGIALDNLAALSQFHTELAGRGPFRFHLLRAKKRLDLVLGLPQ